jgi:hypothetical protein
VSGFWGPGKTEARRESMSTAAATRWRGIDDDGTDKWSKWPAVRPMSSLGRSMWGQTWPELRCLCGGALHGRSGGSGVLLGCFLAL